MSSRRSAANEPDDADSVPVHLRPRFLVMVAAGGAGGAGLREGISLLAPPVSGVPLTTALINVGGAFALGLLLEILSRRGADTGRRRDVRLFAGTGILGGFTTYSALATDTAVLGDAGRLLAASVYGIGTVLVGLAAVAAGVAVGRRATVPT